MNEDSEAKPPDHELEHQRADFPDPAFDEHAGEEDETPLEGEDDDVELPPDEEVAAEVPEDTEEPESRRTPDNPDK
jgi:hypothetical protein